MSAMKSAGGVEPVAADEPSPHATGDSDTAEPTTRPWAEYAAMPIEEQLAAWDKSWAVRSVAAFRRDLPELLRVAEGKWVLYVRGKRVRIADTDPNNELYVYATKDLHLNDDEFAVCYITADQGGEVVGGMGW